MADSPFMPTGAPMAPGLQGQVYTPAENVVPPSGFEAELAKLPPLSPEAAAIGQPPQVMPGMSPQAPQTMDPMAMRQMTMNPMLQSIKQEQGAITKIGAEQAKLAEGQAAIYGQQVNHYQQAEQTFQQHMGTLESERQAFMNDIRETHIDPDRYMHNMGTGQRITSIIGLMLGGLGEGLSGKANTAMQYLNKQVDNDIASQKADLGKKENLLSANLRQFGNVMEAEKMTRIMHNDYITNLVQEQAAKAGSPLAKANAEMLVAQKQRENAMLQTQLAVLGGTRAGGIQPAQAVQFVVPKEQHKEAYAEIEKQTKMENGLKVVNQAMQNVAKLQSTGSRVSSPFQSKAQIDAYNLEIESNAKEIFGGLSDTELHLMNKSKIDYLDNPKTQQTKILVVNNMLKKHMATPVLDAYGLSRPMQEPQQEPVKGANGQMYTRQGNFMVPANGRK